MFYSNFWTYSESRQCKKPLAYFMKSASLFVYTVFCLQDITFSFVTTFDVTLQIVPPIRRIIAVRTSMHQIFALLRRRWRFCRCRRTDSFHDVRRAVYFPRQLCILKGYFKFLRYISIISEHLQQCFSTGVPTKLWWKGDFFDVIGELKLFLLFFIL